MSASAAQSEARLRAVLGPDEPLDDAATTAWAEGYGIVSPDVARYVEVLRGVPDAIALAMRNLATADGLDLVDADTATLVALQLRAMRPERVLEIGTGIGYLTLHVARAVPDDCVLTSIDDDPIRQGQAHAFLEHDAHRCATELRLGDAAGLLASEFAEERWDAVVLSDPSVDRLDLIDMLVPRLAPGGLLVVPWALRGGRVADAQQAWNGSASVEQQRLLNRCVATEPRLTDVACLTIGDGLLLARRA